MKSHLDVSDSFKMPEWLPEMIQQPTWRVLFYKLAEQYPDCLFLNFTIKVIMYTILYIMQW